MSRPESADDKTVGTADGAPSAPPPDRKRDQRSRVKLLEKLPKLSVSEWSVKEDLRLDEEWSGIVSLGSDSILGPLEPLAPDRREG